VRKSLRTLPLLSASLMLCCCGQAVFGQTAQQSPKPQPSKPPAVGPAAPQSTHYPILLLAFGSEPTWSLRIGQKGPERLDRANYPPIPLEPAEVTHESAADSWTYHAKDTASGAVVAVHITREACTGPTPPPTTTAPASSTSPTTTSAAKFTFRASVDHAQIGTLSGCARIAAELFPKITNQTADDDDATKKKPDPPTITNFKSPTAVAYLNSARKLVFKRGDVVRIVSPDGYQPSVSHDGKQLLYTRNEKNAERTVVLYDWTTGKSTDLIKGNAQQAFWSPDDSRIAFLKSVETKWQVWTMPANAPDKAVSLSSNEALALDGWVDAHTVVVDALTEIDWLVDDGTIKQSVPAQDLYGDSFHSSSTNTIRVHPLNPDLLVVSANWPKPPQSVPADPKDGNAFGFFLYEVRSKRRVVLSPLNLSSQDTDWSRDGLQIFFTGSDSAHRSQTYRIFWDGTGLRRYLDGTDFVVGQ
jgi:hypothetical protein